MFKNLLYLFSCFLVVRCLAKNLLTVFDIIWALNALNFSFNKVHWLANHVLDSWLLHHRVLSHITYLESRWSKLSNNCIIVGFWIDISISSKVVHEALLLKSCCLMTHSLCLCIKELLLLEFHGSLSLLFELFLLLFWISCLLLLRLWIIHVHSTIWHTCKTGLLHAILIIHDMRLCCILYAPAINNIGYHEITVLLMILILLHLLTLPSIYGTLAIILGLIYSHMLWLRTFRAIILALWLVHFYILHEAKIKNSTI